MTNVGIFWFHRGGLLVSRVPVADGVATHNAVDSPVDHVDYWPKLQRRHPELREREYFEIPRGRVIYMTKPKTFHIYLNRVLIQPRIQAALLKEFGLPKRRTKFVPDGHYTTDPNELERLFR